MNQNKDTVMDLSDLESKARAATPGPWFAAEPEPSGTQLASLGIGHDSVWVDRDMTIHEDKHNAAFIAAANPTAVLELIARVRDLEQALGDALRVLDDDLYYGQANQPTVDRIRGMVSDAALRGKVGR